MDSSLKDFLIERKLKLLELEKRAIGLAQVAMAAQIQMADSILIYLASKQTEEDMVRLRLTLEKQASPIDDIKPRQDTQELAIGLMELAAELDKQYYAQKGKDKKPIKYTLDNIPADIKPKSVSSKIYGLRGAGKLPFSIVPRTRTIKGEDGQEKEVLYMVRVTDEEAKRIEQKEKAKEQGE